GMDRFVLRGELALERVHYADPRPLLGPALRQPVLWPRLLRARARPGAPLGQSRHRPPGAGPPLELPAAPPDPAAPGGLAVGRVVRRWPGVRARELRRGSRGPLTLAEIELSDGALRWPAVLRTRRAGDRVVAADLFFDPVALAVQVAHPRRLAAAARGGRRRPGREGA
ncbi:MAG TPA: hypothetical protein VD931_00045, partial [Baekduia sp.]|nr:hypothetical protein [Baekduia sp.]